MKLNAEQYAQILALISAGNCANHNATQAIAENQGNTIAAIDKLWQSLGAIEKGLDRLTGCGPSWTQGFVTAQKQVNEEIAGLLRDLNTKLDAGLRATGEAVAGEIRGLRGELDKVFDVQAVILRCTDHHSGQLESELTDVRDQVSDAILDLRSVLWTTKEKMAARSSRSKRRGGK